MNANWAPGPEGGDGRFEVMIVTEDDHVRGRGRKGWLPVLRDAALTAEVS